MEAAAAGAAVHGRVIWRNSINTVPPVGIFYWMTQCKPLFWLASAVDEPPQSILSNSSPVTTSPVWILIGFHNVSLDFDWLLYRWAIPLYTEQLISSSSLYFVFWHTESLIWLGAAAVDEHPYSILPNSSPLPPVCVWLVDTIKAYFWLAAACRWATLLHTTMLLTPLPPIWIFIGWHDVSLGFDWLLL